jgi:hypothetical protein
MTNPGVNAGRTTIIHDYLPLAGHEGHAGFSISFYRITFKGAFILEKMK